MNTVEKITLIRNMNIIEGTTLDFHQSDRNEKLAGEIGRIDVTELTKDQAVELGFGLWSEENPIYLIPFYLYDYLEYGQTLGSIGGDTKVVTPNYKDINSSDYIDNDYRFGCLAYGFSPKE